MYKGWHSIKFFHFFILMLTCSQAVAVKIDYQFDLSLARYENILLAPIPAGEEWVNALTGTINVVENSATLVANLNANISKFNYKNNQLQDSTIGNMNLNARWIIEPSRFEWLVQDIFTQTLIDQL
ncbi:MAG: hypothetical protein ACC657_18590, partial [Thiohalomonadales bacterium]